MLSCRFSGSLFIVYSPNVKYHNFNNDIAFRFCLGSISDFSNRVPTSQNAGRAILFEQFEVKLWKCFLDFFLIDRHHPHERISAMSWLNYLFLAVELWDSSAQLLMKYVVDVLDISTSFHIHHPASHGIHCDTLVELC